MTEAADTVTTQRQICLSDLNTLIDCEPRIRDLRLAEALEMADPHSIRRIIERHAEAIKAFGIIVSDPDRKPQGGRPSSSFYLNKRQALYVTAKSDTPRAAAITVQMVEVYDAYLAAQSDKPIHVSEFNRRTSVHIDSALKLKRNIDRLEVVADRMEALPGTPRGSYIPDGSPVTYDALVEIIRKATGGMIGPQATFGRNLLDAVETKKGNPWAGPCNASVSARPALGEIRARPLSRRRSGTYYGEAVRDLLQRDPEISTAAIARELGCSYYTARDWRRTYQERAA